MDLAGTVYVTWSDCRFNAQCAANGVVLVTSRDGIVWTQPRILIGSSDGGRTWQAPQRLNAESIALDWVAETGLGRMLADYISVSYVGGRPVAVLSLAAEPVRGELRQAIFASTRVR